MTTKQSEKKIPVKKKKPEASVKIESKDPVFPAPTEIPTVAEVSITTEEKKKTSDECPHCGLPKSEWESAYSRLRTDLQAKNARKLCPRCFNPVEW